MNYPRHLGIIPDGNRTWAKEKDLPSIIGHKAGFENFRKLANYCFSQTTIEILTSRGASTENIKERSPEELEYLYEIYQMITQDIIDLHTNYGVGFRWIGSEEWLPINLVEFFHEQEKTYPSRNGKYFILAVNYGWNDEILRGINSFLQTHPSSTHITADNISSSMDLWDLAPVDLVIRTKGKMAKRLSGFMTWWIAYAELYFSDYYFPDFNNDELQKALEWYNSIVEYRNFGK